MADCKEIADADDNKLETHQVHILHDGRYGTGFKCEDVITMEKADGRHSALCPHVGYISAKKCGCNDAN